MLPSCGNDFPDEVIGLATGPCVMIANRLFMPLTGPGIQGYDPHTSGSDGTVSKRLCAFAFPDA